jgi:hypothetical protein
VESGYEPTADARSMFSLRAIEARARNALFRSLTGYR